MTPFSKRLALAIKRLGTTEAERARKLGYSARQLDNWERGGRVPTALERLEKAGVIHIADDACPCHKRTSK